jgi:membrane protease YdiL (CAAX protease family)
VSLWRIVAGAAVVLLVWAAFTFVSFIAGVVLSGALNEHPRGGDPSAFIIAFLASPAGVATALSSFLGMTAGVWLALRLMHGRAFGTVLGASGGIAWRDFWRGLLVSLIASGLAEAATYLVDPTLQRSDLAVVAWLIWLAPLTLLLFVQVSAEEIAFRGYLTQSLAARFSSPLAWAAIPIAIFTLLHYDSHSLPSMTAAMLLSIAAFTVLVTVLVVRTGNLGAGIGVHLGLNAVGILFVSHMSWLSGGALFRSAPLDLGSWSHLDAFLVGLVSIASFALMAALLLHPRSPLRVGGA